MSRAEDQLSYRNTKNLPQSTTEALFKVQGGRIHLIDLAGEVTELFQTQTNNMKFIHDPDNGNANVDLCAVLDVTGKAVGTHLRMSGDLSDALESASDVKEQLGDYKPVILNEGSVLLSCSASSTGKAKFSAIWKPLDPGARLVRA